jgi:excisionase family DNA binding protein
MNGELLPSPSLLQTSEVARLLDVSADTVRVWERLGRLHAVRVGRGMRLFDVSEVFAFADDLARARGESQL